MAVLPLGTGNDLARVLGWGSSCDDDTHLPQLLEKYEKASTKMLDRWSIMTFERTIAIPKLSLTTTQPAGQLHSTMIQYENSLVNHIQNILQSDETTIVLNSARHLCETVKDFAAQVSDNSFARGDDQLASKCDILHQKLNLLLQTLNQEEIEANLEGFEDEENIRCREDSDCDMSFEKKKSDKTEKDLSNLKSRSRRRQIGKESVLVRANSLKRAIRSLIEHAEQAVDDQNGQSSANVIPTIKISITSDCDYDSAMEKQMKTMDTLKVVSSSVEPSPCPSPSPTVSRLSSISPLPDLRRDSTCDDSESVLNLPVPSQFADGSSRRSSQTGNAPTEEVLTTTANEQSNEVVAEAEALAEIQRIASTKTEATQDDKESQELVDQDDDKECSSILSAISNEEISIASDILDQKSFYPRKNSDGDDVNGHIGHIDSPETDTADTYPNSEALHGESLMDDISSVLAMTGCDQDSGENTYTDDTTLFTNEFLELNDEERIARKKSLKKEASEKRRRSSKKRQEKVDLAQCGFENRAFLTNLVIDKDNKLEADVKYCSLARFEEGSDISRCSFKKKAPASKLSKTEANVNRQSILSEEIEIENIVCNIEQTAFPQVSVIVEPPSPVFSEELRNERLERLAHQLPSSIYLEQSGSDYDISRTLREDYLSSKIEQLSIKSDRTSNHSSSSNLLGIDYEQMQFLSCSPAATRRISSGSLLKPCEAAALAASASSLYADEKKDRKEEKDEKAQGESKTLPIINPLVRLPSWPRKY